MFLSFGYLGLSPDTGLTLCRIALWDCFWGQNWLSFLCDLVEANKRSAHWTRFQNSLLGPPPLPPGPQNNPIVQQETTPTSLPLELKMANFSFLGTVRLLLAKSIWKTASNPCSGTQASTVYSEYTPQVACEKCQFANQVEGKFR